MGLSWRKAGKSGPERETRGTRRGLITSNTEAPFQEAGAKIRLSRRTAKEYRYFFSRGGEKLTQKAGTQEPQEGRISTGRKSGEGGDTLIYYSAGARAYINYNDIGKGKRCFGEEKAATYEEENNGLQKGKQGVAFTFSLSDGIHR